MAQSIVYLYRIARIKCVTVITKLATRQNKYKYTNIPTLLKGHNIDRKNCYNWLVFTTYS